MSDEKLNDAQPARNARNERGAEGDTDRGAMSNTSDGKLNRAREGAEPAGPRHATDDGVPAQLPIGRVAVHCSACSALFLLEIGKQYDSCLSCGIHWDFSTLDGARPRFVDAADANPAKYCTQCGHLFGGHYAGCPTLNDRKFFAQLGDERFYRSPAPLRSLEQPITGAEEKLEPLSAQHQHDADCGCPAEEDFAESSEFRPLRCSTCSGRAGNHVLGCPDAPAPSTKHRNLEDALRNAPNIPRPRVNISVEQARARFPVLDQPPRSAFADLAHTEPLVWGAFALGLVAGALMITFIVLTQ